MKQLRRGEGLQDNMQQLVHLDRKFSEVISTYAQRKASRLSQDTLSTTEVLRSRRERGLQSKSTEKLISSLRNTCSGFHTARPGVQFKSPRKSGSKRFEEDAGKSNILLREPTASQDLDEQASPYTSTKAVRSQSKNDKTSDVRVGRYFKIFTFQTKFFLLH